MSICEKTKGKAPAKMMRKIDVPNTMQHAKNNTAILLPRLDNVPKRTWAPMPIARATKKQEKKTPPLVLVKRETNELANSMNTPNFITSGCTKYSSRNGIYKFAKFLLLGDLSA
jgi:hypothetical protein